MSRPEWSELFIGVNIAATAQLHISWSVLELNKHIDYRTPYAIEDEFVVHVSRLMDKSSVPGFLSRSMIENYEQVYNSGESSRCVVIGGRDEPVGENIGGELC